MDLKQTLEKFPISPEVLRYFGSAFLSEPRFTEEDKIISKKYKIWEAQNKILNLIKERVFKRDEDKELLFWEIWNKVLMGVSSFQEKRLEKNKYAFVSWVSRIAENYLFSETNYENIEILQELFPEQVIKDPKGIDFGDISKPLQEVYDNAKNKKLKLTQETAFKILAGLKNYSGHITIPSPEGGFSQEIKGEIARLADDIINKNIYNIKGASFDYFRKKMRNIIKTKYPQLQQEDIFDYAYKFIDELQKEKLKRVIKIFWKCKSHLWPDDFYKKLEDFPEKQKEMKEKVISLNEPIGEDEEGNEMTLEDIIPEKQERTISESERFLLIEKFIKQYSREANEIVRFYLKEVSYLEKKSDEEIYKVIAKELNKKEGAVKKAIQRFKKRANDTEQAKEKEAFLELLRQLYE